ncbi:glycosyltransferase [Streptococcus ovis]
MSIYNEKLLWIQQSIDSILNQTYTNLELIIIVDNPEIDSSILEYLTTLSSQYSNVRIEKNTVNIGLASSMNKAIELAKGEYIARMDADDISLSSRIEEELKHLEENEYDLVFSDKINMSEDGAVFFEEKISDRDIQKSLYSGSNIVNHPTVLVKRSVLIALKGYRNFPNSEDYDLWLRMLESGYKIGHIRKVLLKYRLRSTSASIGRALEQYYISEYIVSLSEKRRQQNGKDQYSMDELQRFLNKKKITPRRQKNFLIASQYLSQSLSAIQEYSFLKAISSLLISFIYFPSLPFKAMLRRLNFR